MLWISRKPVRKRLKELQYGKGAAARGCKKQDSSFYVQKQETRIELLRTEAIEYNYKKVVASK